MTASGRTSAGLLMYRRRDGVLEVLLVHPGGPFFRNKDLGAWTLPKGEPNAGETMLEAACREFEEETGTAPSGPYVELGSVRQKAGKVVHAFAFEGDLDPKRVRSITFEIEWPPRSGRRASFPEVDRADFFSLDAARAKINPAQIALLDRLLAELARD